MNVLPYYYWQAYFVYPPIGSALTYLYCDVFELSRFAGYRCCHLHCHHLSILHLEFKFNNVFKLEGPSGQFNLYRMILNYTQNGCYLPGFLRHFHFLHAYHSFSFWTWYVYTLSLMDQKSSSLIFCTIACSSIQINKWL